MMLHGGCVWEVMNLFCKMKDEDANFCCALKTNERGQSQEIAWFTAEMRLDLIRYHDSLLLDMR